ncbi:dsrm domain-containing protein [Cephalotus follicularis]|uniref:Dsrm domain-containing protein n=1 Tax=Cephalotus follicularis TaxID=3775 RepID=A0A1Q3D915_CEPFO|nr:dsrm domain-containing protein [Cephalotus follicularis]
MFKNQLQELAQRSCFNLPSYACIREGPDHAPRFKASVNFNGEIFESPSYCTTLRQAEHAAAEVALNNLSSRGPSRSLTARILDETGIYKNLLQETAHRAGLNLPVYTTVRSGPGHVPIFTCTVELAGMNFTGEPAKTKKQAEKNAAIAAWSALKRKPNVDALTNKEVDSHEQQDQAVVARFLSNLRPKDDGKQFKRRDQNQARRSRVIKGCRESTSLLSPSTSNNPLQDQQWRLLDLLMESALDGSTPKRNSFVSLLPPPPPRTASMILPPASHRNTPSTNFSNRPILSQIRDKSQMKKQEIPIPMQEHLEDEEEWLGIKLDAIKQSIEMEGSSSSSNSSSLHGASSLYRPSHLKPNTLYKTTTQHEHTHMRSRVIGSPSSSPIAPHVSRDMYTGGFNFNPQRIAPAVQIRSVIPVCAAPPPTMRPPPTVKDTSTSTTISASSPSSTIMSTQTGADHVSTSSASSSKFNKPIQLATEFNKLQL